MVASIEGTLSRAELGMRAPDRVSYNITPENGGAAVHWGGPRQSNATLDQCIRTWLRWQDYHMAPGGLGTRFGANDIAYNAAFNNFGIIFAGRGLGVRSGAQGSNYGNQNFHAFVWIGGSGQEPNELALNALEWLVLEARNTENAGRHVSPHSRFNSTSCPGVVLTRHAASLHNRDISTGDGGKEPWEGKVVRAVYDGVNYYHQPGWASSGNPVAGKLPKNWGFLGGIHEKRKVGGGYQYRVTNSNGHEAWITASERYVRLSDR